MAGVARNPTPARPFAQLSRTTNQTISSGGVGAQVLAVTSTFDNGVATTGTAMNDTTNSRIYARVTGLYAVYGTLTYATLTNFKFIGVSFSDAQTPLCAAMPNDSIVGGTISVSGVVRLTAGAFITLSAYHQKGSNDTVLGSISLSFIGKTE